jgi:hypothetical protein
VEAVLRVCLLLLTFYMLEDIDLLEVPTVCNNLYLIQKLLDDYAQQIQHLQCFFFLALQKLILDFDHYKNLLLILMNRMNISSRREVSKDYFGKQSIVLS